MCNMYTFIIHDNNNNNNYTLFRISSSVMQSRLNDIAISLFHIIYNTPMYNNIVAGHITVGDTAICGYTLYYCYFNNSIIIL